MVQLLPPVSEQEQSLSQVQWCLILCDKLKAGSLGDISFFAIKCHCSGDNSKLLLISLSTLSVHTAPTHGYFHPLSSNPASSDPSSPNHTSLISFLSLPIPPSSLSIHSSPSPFLCFHYHIHLSTSFHSLTSSVLILFLSFPPFSSSLSSVLPLLIPSFLNGPSVEWSYCCASLSLSLCVSGAALQGPPDWIRAFYSLRVDHRTQMQIATSGKRAVVNPRQQCCLSASQITTCDILSTSC